MVVDVSTEYLLLDSDTQDDTSTEALISENMVTGSTGSLIHDDIQNLLDRVHISEEPTLNSESESVSTSDTPRVEVTPISTFENNIPVIYPIPDIDNQYGPVLKSLYNKIQVFLLRSHLSLDFLKVFKRYVYFLIDYDKDPLQDQYIMKIQNELDNSIGFSPVMDDILARFLIQPETLEMKLALYEHHHNRKLMKTTMQSLQLKHIIRNSLYGLEKIWHEYLKRKYISAWKRVYDKCTGHLQRQANALNKYRLLSFGFDKILDYKYSNASRSELADHYFINHMFSKIKRKYQILATLDFQAKEQLELNMMKHNFKNWQLNYLRSKFRPIGIGLKRHLFKKWRMKRTEYEDFETKADITKYVMKVHPHFKLWVYKTRERQDEFGLLKDIEKRFILRKYLIRMKNANQDIDKLNDVQIRLDSILLGFTFKELWQKRFKERIHMYSLNDIHEKQLGKKYLGIWIALFKMREKSKVTLASNIKRNVLSVWQNTWQQLNRERQLEASIVKRYYLKWLTKSQQIHKVEKFKKQVKLRKFFLRWKSRTEEISALVSRCNIFEKRHNMTFYLYQWRQKHNLANKMESQVILFQKLSAVSMVKTGLNKIDHLKRKLEYCDDSFKKRLLEHYLSFWVKKYLSNKSICLNILLEDNQKKQGTRLLSRFITLWNHNFELYAKECEFKARYSRERILKEKIFTIIKNKQIANTRLVILSNDVRVETLKSKAILRWQERIKDINGFETRLHRELDRKNLSLLLISLNRLSMRLLKIQRNQEMVRIFRSRWERATVRGLLNLWKTRTRQSPKKVRITRHMPLEKYLHLITPRRRATEGEIAIPGSEQVKNNRMEAVKSRYSRARHSIPSPIKSSTTLDSTVKRKFINLKTQSLRWDNSLTETSNMAWSPPRLALEKINKTLASKIHDINFDKISDLKLDPIIDRSTLESDEESMMFDDSPTRRASKGA